MDTPSSYGIIALKFLWDQYKYKIELKNVKVSAWIEEFFFCLLGGYSITYELNYSAFNILKQESYFTPNFFRSNPGIYIEKTIESELSKPQFKPLKINGEQRKYRFPRKKSKIICRAGHWLIETCNFNISSLIDNDQYKTRNIFLDCPGYGYKTASWFLRNIGRGPRLAIIDVHIHQTLQDLDIIGSNLDPSRDYIEIEEVFCDVCDQIGAEVELMDLIIWKWSRGVQSIYA